jgi:hypothetical protein
VFFIYAYMGVIFFGKWEGRNKWKHIKQLPVQNRNSILFPPFPFSHFFLFFFLSPFLFRFAGTVQPGIYLTYHTNFDNFGMALITLFRVATNDAWPGIMREAAVQKPHCASGQCGSYAAYPYFYSFLLLVSMILFNLVTGKGTRTIVYALYFRYKICCIR